MTKKARSLWISAAVVVIVAVVVLVFALRRGGDETITIGVILPLTGSRANAGEDGRAGIELAMSELRKSQPDLAKRIRLVIEDNASQAKDSVTAFKKLTTADGARIVIGPLASSTALCARRQQLKHVALSAYVIKPPTLWCRAIHFQKRVYSSQQAERDTADYVRSRLQADTAAVLFMNDDTGEGYRIAFVQKFTALGGRVIAEESYSPDATDYRSQLAKIKAAAPAALFVPATAWFLATALNQAKELAMNIPVISNFGVEGSDLITLARENAEGVLYTSIELGSGVADAYRQKHGKELNVVSALCYDAIVAITEAIGTTGTDDPDSIRQYLEESKGISGATGIFTFDAIHDTVRVMVIKTVKNGTFVIAGD